MTPHEFDNQVRSVLPAILTKLGLHALSATASTLPPFEVKHRLAYRNGLTQIEAALEDLAARGRNHEKTLGLVRDCLTELHLLR